MALFSNRRLKKFLQAVEGSPQDIDTILDLAKKLIEDGEDALVMEKLEDLLPAIDDEERKGEVLLRLANLHKSRGRYDRAIDFLGDALSLPGSKEQRSLRHYLLGVCQLEHGRGLPPDEAQGLFVLAAENFSRSEEIGASERLRQFIALNSGYAHFSAGDTGKARVALVKAAKAFATDELSDTEWVKLFLTLAEIAAERNVDNAVKLCRKALEFAQDDLERGRVNLTLGKLIQGTRMNEAVEKLETAARYLKSHPEAVEEQISLALELPRVYLGHNMVREAIVEAEQTLKNMKLPDRGLFLVYELLSDAYLREDNIPEAIVNRYQAVSLAPTPDKKAFSLYRLGLLQLQEGEDESACNNLKDAQESGLLSPTHFAESQLAMARGLVNLERSDEAVKLLLHVLNLGYDGEKNIRAKEILSDAYIAREQWLKAAEILKDLAALETYPEYADLARERIKDLRIRLEAGQIGGLLAQSDRTSLEILFAEALGEKSVFERLRVGLTKTRSNLVGRLESLVQGYTEIDDDLLEEVEEILVTSDLGIDTTMMIMKHLETQVAKGELTEPSQLTAYLQEEMRKILTEHGDPTLDVTGKKPYVLMVVGVNGVGKTTTIAKLARRFTQQGLKVALAAGDTFRAGAIEQLRIWSERVGCDFVSREEGSDPSAVAFDAVDAALKLESDLLIIDTAGRLHTKVNLMEELKKVRRVVEKKIPGAPHETLLVLDSTNGQNAISQAKTFNEAIHVDGIALTKLDGTAKGGIVVSISHELKIPVKLIGVGEKMDDLQDFVPEEFIKALFAMEAEEEHAQEEAPVAKP